MMLLFVNCYIDGSAQRQEELVTAMTRNRANEFLDVVPVMGRPTFQTYFDMACEGVNIIANSDIVFDETIQLAQMMRDDEAYALSRWDGPTIQNSDSQDAWIFRGKPKAGMFLDFVPGTCGCDNRLAWELHHAGYRASNPAKSIKAHHLHASGVRHYVSDPATSVPKPYLLIKPHLLGETPEYREILAIA